MQIPMLYSISPQHYVTGSRFVRKEGLTESTLSTSEQEKKCFLRHVFVVVVGLMMMS
jgi:hypothetical protein